MPKIIGPLFSLSAEGTLGRCLSYFQRKGSAQLRRMYTPHITNTDALKTVKGFMRDTVWTFQHLTPNIVSDWNTWASNYMKNASGYNAFTSYYMIGLTQGYTPSLFPPT